MTETSTVQAVPVKKVENGVQDKTMEMPEERITDQDKHFLDMAIMQRKLAISEARSAELAHNHIVLQLYMKYGMSVEKDMIDDQGVIKRNSIPKQEAK